MMPFQVEDKNGVTWTAVVTDHDDVWIHVRVEGAGGPKRATTRRRAADGKFYTQTAGRRVYTLSWNRGSESFRKVVRSSSAPRAPRDAAKAAVRAWLLDELGGVL